MGVCRRPRSGSWSRRSAWWRVRGCCRSTTPRRCWSRRRRAWETPPGAPPHPPTPTHHQPSGAGCSFANDRTVRQPEAATSSPDRSPSTSAYAAGRVHTPNLRTIVRHVPACGLGVLRDHEDALVALATRAGPAEVGVFCQALAEVHRPEGEEAKVRAAGLRSVRITGVGDLAHLDAMLDPAAGRPTQGHPGRDRPCQPQPRRRSDPRRAVRGRAGGPAASRHGRRPAQPCRASPRTPR